MKIENSITTAAALILLMAISAIVVYFGYSMVKLGAFFQNYIIVMIRIGLIIFGIYFFRSAFLKKK